MPAVLFVGGAPWRIGGGDPCLLAPLALSSAPASYLAARAGRAARLGCCSAPRAPLGLDTPPHATRLLAPAAAPCVGPRCVRQGALLDSRGDVSRGAARGGAVRSGAGGRFRAPAGKRASVEQDAPTWNKRGGARPDVPLDWQRPWSRADGGELMRGPGSLSLASSGMRPAQPTAPGKKRRTHARAKAPLSSSSVQGGCSHAGLGPARSPARLRRESHPPAPGGGRGLPDCRR